jgi:hypothetical protein
MRCLFILLTLAACERAVTKTAQLEPIMILPGQVRDWIGADTVVFKDNPEPHWVEPHIIQACVASAEPVSTPTVDFNAMAYVDIYLNDLADAHMRSTSQAQTDLQAASKSPVPFPEGAVFLRHKTGLARTHQGQLIKDSSQEGWGGMFKGAPGSSPASGDWSYFYYSEADGLTSGSGMECGTCHGVYSKDWPVLGDWSATRTKDPVENGRGTGSAPHSWSLPEPGTPKTK